MKRCAWMAALLPLLSVGCSDFERLDFQPRTTPPQSVSLSFESIVLIQGIAVAAKAVPLDSGDDMMDEETTVELTSNAPSILGVEVGAEDGYFDNLEEDAPPLNWNFVFFGASPGKTTVTVTIDGEKTGDIPVEVKAQP